MKGSKHRRPRLGPELPKQNCCRPCLAMTGGIEFGKAASTKAKVCCRPGRQVVKRCKSVKGIGSCYHSARDLGDADRRPHQHQGGFCLHICIRHPLIHPRCSFHSPPIFFPVSKSPGIRMPLGLGSSNKPNRNRVPCGHCHAAPRHQRARS